MKEERNDMAGTWQEKSTVNGETIYKGGVPALVRIRRNGLLLKVSCISCAYHRLYSAGTNKILIRECMKNRQDNGEPMVILYDCDTREHWRCPQWHPRPCFTQALKSDGTVQSRAFIRWKTRNPTYLMQPHMHGYRDGTSLHEWLVRTWREEIMKAR